MPPFSMYHSVLSYPRTRVSLRRGFNSYHFIRLSAEAIFGIEYLSGKHKQGDMVVLHQNELAAQRALVDMEAVAAAFALSLLEDQILVGWIQLPSHISSSAYILQGKLSIN